jgi:hypothetical protein
VREANWQHNQHRAVGARRKWGVQTELGRMAKWAGRRWWAGSGNEKERAGGLLESWDKNDLGHA